MKSTFLSSLGIIISLTAVLSPSLALAAQKPSKSPTVTPTAKVTSFDQYQQDCVARVQKQGLKADIAKDVCNCTIGQFKNQYNLQQFNAVVQKSKTDKVAARKLANVGESCFEKVLYE
ncbi:MAG: hypothetical protein VKJ02_15930 [Snowella sp.]|nr:hypothetical protein [Snowella sp.]